MGEIRDIIVDCLDEDLVIEELESLGTGRLVMDPEKPDEPFIDEDGFLTLRFRDAGDVVGVARHLQQKILGLRVIEIADPTRPDEVPPPIPGSFRAQRGEGLIID